jgi:uncharacterized protein
VPKGKPLDHLTAVFRSYLRFTLRHPGWILLLAVLSVGASLYLTMTRLAFSTDRTQLLDPEHPIQRSFGAFREEFGGNTDLVVLVMGNPRHVRPAVDQLGEALVEDKDYFQDVLYRLDMPEIARHSLYFLSYLDLRKLESQVTSLESWVPAINQGFPTMVDGLLHRDKADVLQLIEPLSPVLAKVYEGALRSLESRGEAAYESPLPIFAPELERLRGTTFKPGQTTFYNTVGKDSACMLIARPTDSSGAFSADKQTIARLREQVARVSSEHPRVSCLVSGEPVINIDEMVGARDDAVKCSLTALVLVSLILTLAFSDVIRPLCAVLSLLIGLSWSFAFAAVTVGTLNLLTVHFATILVGLSMTFAIQLLSHYQDQVSQNLADRPRVEILEEAVSETGLQTLIGAVTTAVAFWTLHFANFRAAGQLGLITGTGVLLTFFSIWTFFPVLVRLTEGQRTARPLRIPGFQVLGKLICGRVWWALVVSLMITFYSATWINRVDFNYNMLSLQAAGSDSVRVEHLLQSLGYSSLYAVATATTVSEVQSLTLRYQALPTIAHVESVATLLPKDIERKHQPIETILRIVQQIDGVPHLDDFLGSGRAFRTARQLLSLKSLLEALSPRLRELFAALPEGADRTRLLKAFEQLSSSLEKGSPGPLEAGLRRYENQLFAELVEYKVFLDRQLPTPPDVLGSLPPALRSRSISKDGRYSLRIFPRANCWEREPLAQFVADLEGTDSGVTGTPLLIYYYLEELRQAYSSAGTNALLVISVLLLLYYRSLVQAALALFPKLLGVVWMIGAMGLCGMTFNAANFLALPIILGIGLVFGINILSEYHRTGVEGLYTSATGGAVLLSGVVATVGFASFALAQHVGVASFGSVMAAGVVANMLTSLGTLPALLGGWERIRGRGKDA